MKQHYVYEITNITNGMAYIGVRSCNCKPEEDIGIKYFSSSTDEAFIQEQKTTDNFEYKVLQVFRTRKEAADLEIQLHEKYNIAVNKNYYNLCKQANGYPDRTGIPHSDALKKHWSATRKGKNNAMFGRHHTEESCDIMRKAKEGLYNGENNPNFGKTASKITKMKMSKKKKGRKYFHTKIGKIIMVFIDDPILKTDNWIKGRGPKENW